jgi:hypothetical protein
MVHWRSFTGLALASLVALLVSGCTSGPAATNDPGNLSDRQASGTRATPARTYELCNDLDWCHVKEDDVPSLLRRSLHLPKLQPGEECPTSRGRHYATSDFGGTALGKGPVQPLIDGSRERRRSGEKWCVAFPPTSRQTPLAQRQDPVVRTPGLSRPCLHSRTTPRRLAQDRVWGSAIVGGPLPLTRTNDKYGRWVPRMA